MSSSIKNKKIKTFVLLLTGLVTLPALASQQDSFFSRFTPNHGHIVLQAGGFSAYQGNSQHIGIDTLIGDDFTVTSHADQNFLVGLGYFIDGPMLRRFSLQYGLNAFYLPQTMVKGNIVQEDMFTNLSYRYSITNYPIYIAAKALINTDSDKYNVTVDLGAGPNIIHTNKFSESSLDGGETIPDRAFSTNTSEAFSITAGVGVRLNNVFGCVPVEIGYRFFYLGQGNLRKLTNQLTDSLNTGDSFANALIVSISD